MGSAFKSKNQSTSTYEPFNGQQKQEYQQLLDYVKNSGNFNNLSSYLDQISAMQGDTSGIETTRDYITGMVDNPTINNFAQGNYLDPLSNPYQMGAYNQGISDLRDQFGSMFDQTNASFGANGFANSSMRANAQNQNAESVANAQGRFASDFLNQAYAQNTGDMFNANSLMSNWAEQLRAQGLNEYEVSQDEIAKQLELFAQRNNLGQQDIANWANIVEMGKNPTQTNTQTQSGGWGGALLGGVTGALTGGLNFRPKTTANAYTPTATGGTNAGYNWQQYAPNYSSQLRY